MQATLTFSIALEAVESITLSDSEDVDGKSSYSIYHKTMPKKRKRRNKASKRRFGKPYQNNADPSLQSQQPLVVASINLEVIAEEVHQAMLRVAKASAIAAESMNQQVKAIHQIIDRFRSQPPKV